jgi:hypothetical protein
MITRLKGRPAQGFCLMLILAVTLMVAGQSVACAEELTPADHVVVRKAERKLYLYRGHELRTGYRSGSIRSGTRSGKTTTARRKGTTSSRPGTRAAAIFCRSWFPIRTLMTSAAPANAAGRRAGPS